MPLSRPSDDPVSLPDPSLTWPPRQLERLLHLFARHLNGSPVPATSDSEINRATGRRIKYVKVDADTGEEVASDEIMKAIRLIDTYIEIIKDELENIALDSRRILIHAT